MGFPKPILKAAQNKSILASTNEFLQVTERDLKLHYLIKSLIECYLKLTVIFSGQSKLAGKVSKKHVLNFSFYIYCVTYCSCFPQLSLLVLLYFLYFSVFLLLLEYVNFDSSFCYQVLVEVSMFLIIFIFIILSMFVYIMYFCRIYRKKNVFVYDFPKDDHLLSYHLLLLTNHVH